MLIYQAMLWLRPFRFLFPLFDLRRGSLAPRLMVLCIVAAVAPTIAAVWAGGGTPPDIANGYVLTAGVPAAATPAAVVPPKTGNAGMLNSDAASGWVVLAIALVALGAVAGARTYAGRRA